MTDQMSVLKPGLESSEDKPGGPEWRVACKALWEYMRREMRDSVKLRKILYPKNGGRHELRFVPFVWRVVREKTPQRIERYFRAVDGSALDADTLALIDSVYLRAGVERAMRSARKQLVALNQSTVWVWPDANGFDLKAFTVPPHRQAVAVGDPLSEDENSVKAWELEVPTGAESSIGMVRVGVAHIEKGVAYWRSTLETENGAPLWQIEGVDPGVNPLGQMPVAMMRGEDVEAGYWWVAMPESLLLTQRALNMGFTTSGVTAAFQGFSQMYTKGVSAGSLKELATGPETCVGLPDKDSELGYATPGADLAGTSEVLSQYLQASVSSEGLSPQTFLKSSGITALAKRIENQSRDAERRWDMDTIERAEQRVYDLLRAWLRILRGVDILPPAKVSIEVRDVVDVVDPLHDAQARALDIYSAQTDEIAARAKRDGVSQSEARRRVLDSIEVTAELARARANAGAPMAPVAGGAGPPDGTQVGVDAADEVEAGQAVPE